MAGDPTSGIFIGSAAGGGNPQQLELKRANRHGLIAGATGTGKTVTLQGIVEGLSVAGVPTFVADVKGDLSGLAMAGSPTSKIHSTFAQRATDIGMADWTYHDTPVQFWDLFGEQGHPVRTTVSEMGPLLLSRLMNLNEVQEGVLNIAFNVADKEGLQCLEAVRRFDPALAAAAEEPGRRPFLWRAGARSCRLHGPRRSGPRHRQHSRRRPAHGEPAPLRYFPAVAA